MSMTQMMFAWSKEVVIIEIKKQILDVFWT